MSLILPLFPGTGTPEAGGLNFKEFINFILKFKDYEIVGVDLVELSPEHDISGISQAQLQNSKRNHTPFIGLFSPRSS